MTTEQCIKSYRCEVCGLEYLYYNKCPICLNDSNKPIMDIVDKLEKEPLGEPQYPLRLSKIEGFSGYGFFNQGNTLENWLLKWKYKNLIKHYQRKLNEIK